MAMTRSQSGKACASDASSLFLRNATLRMAAGWGAGADIHEAFVSLGCAPIRWRLLRVDWGSRMKHSFARNIH